MKSLLLSPKSFNVNVWLLSSNISIESSEDVGNLLTPIVIEPSTPSPSASTTLKRNI